MNYIKYPLVFKANDLIPDEINDVKDRSKRAFFGCPSLDGFVASTICSANCYIRGYVTGICHHGVCICRRSNAPATKASSNSIQSRRWHSMHFPH